MDTDNIVRVEPTLTSLGIIVGTVLCILQGIGTIDIGWFWATFPFWIAPVASLGLAIISACIILLADTR